MDLNIIYNGPNQLGESPLWDHRHHRLYWVDIIACELHAYDPKTQEHQLWSLPAEPGCIALYEETDLIVGLNNQIAVIRLPSGQVDVLATVIHDGKTMLNDGKCDPQGRFWLGSKDVGLQEAVASLYRFDPDHSLTKIKDQLVVSNGLAWPSDQAHFLLADSAPRKVYRFAYHPINGDIDHQEDFITIPEEQGYPDGLTLDKDDYIWLAHWDGWRITRFTPSGEVDQVIELPIPRPTSCCFGGDDYRTLFITSASYELTSEERQKAPLSGAVFAMRVSVAGRPENVFVSDEHAA